MIRLRRRRSQSAMSISTSTARGGSLVAAIATAAATAHHLRFPADCSFPFHIGRILAAKITLLHFLTSSEISLAKSAGDPPRGVPPRLASRDWSFGSAMLTLISLFSFSMTSVGVRLGPPMPYHELAS